MEFQPIIMAGGRGTHMPEMTSSIPKPLLPIGNKPMIWHSVNMLEKAGFNEVIIVTLSSIKSQIDHILKEFKIKVKLFSVNEDQDFDTLDSLRLIKDEIVSDLLVISCDLISDLPLHRLADIHRIHNSTVTMLLAPARPILETLPGSKSRKKEQPKQREFIGMSTTDQADPQVLFLVNEADLEEETLPVKQSMLFNFPRFQIRTDLHDAHVYLMKRSILNFIVHNKSKTSLRSELLPYIVNKQFAKKKESLPENMEEPNQGDLSDIFSFVKNNNERNFIYDLSLTTHKVNKNLLSCYAFLYKDGVCLNANTMSSYVEANRIVAKPESSFIDDDKRIHQSAEIKEKAQVGVDSIVGEKTVIQEKSSVKRSIIGRECSIASFVKITNCVIMDKVVIENSCNLQGCIVCDGAKIEENAKLQDCFIGCHQVVEKSANLVKETVADTRSVMMEFD